MTCKRPFGLDNFPLHGILNTFHQIRPASRRLASHVPDLLGTCTPLREYLEWLGRRKPLPSSRRAELLQEEQIACRSPQRSNRRHLNIFTRGENVIEN